MSGSPQWLLQTAIYSRLTGDATLTALLASSTAVYDDVPDGVAFPYLTIGQFTGAPRDTMGTTGRDVTVTVHAWSQYEGKKEAEQILSRVDEMLDRWQPTISGWNPTVMLHEFGPEIMDDPDGITRHGVSRYRLHLHQ